MDIPLSILILLCILFILIGAVIMLLLQYYVFIRISNLPEETAEQKDINAKYSLPLALQQTAQAFNASATAAAAAAAANGGGGSSSSSSSEKDISVATLASLNFVMQFLFHELKNTSRVRKWFYRKLSIELDELLTKTTTGRLFDKLTIKELELGDQFPEIKMLRVHNVALDESEGRIENLDLLLDLRYAGNFRTSIDADMVLGKKGSLTLKVKQLSGLARLQFTRLPYTHWSLSFLGDPELDLAIESKYQGRQMQSNITSLISNQIRKAVRRKHTLPNYKLRYKPFFHQIPEEDSDNDIQPNGLLEVKVSELSRLMCPRPINDIYCSLTMASLAFVEVHQKDDRNVIVSLDVEIRKAKNQQIGLVFKQAAEQVVIIEAVLPNTPACKANFKSGDVLIAVEGKRVFTIQQVAKVIKSLQSSAFSLRIERVIPGIIRNDAILEDLELYEDLGDQRQTFNTPKPNEIDVNSSKNLLTRHTSMDKNTSSESSLNNTPTSSPKKSKLIAKALKKTISRESSESAKDEESKVKLRLNPKIEEKPRSLLVSPSAAKQAAQEGINDVEHYYQHSTIDCALSRLIHMEDLSQFKLDAHCRFLNVCVYGKSTSESQLLGFVNIPISQILTECSETSLTQCWKTFELNPPMPEDLKNHILSSQSGFIPNLCFGDILMAFTWTGNPNLTANETLARQPFGKLKLKTPTTQEKSDDSGMSDSLSMKSMSNDSSSVATTPTVSVSSQPRTHNFIRTHFQRAIQCDFCGKKIWLKDAAQCRECSMSCHKKCITKCQNSTVCGPVDCSSVLQQTATPEFTVTDTTMLDASEGEEAMANASEDEQTLTKASQPTGAGLEVHRSSLTGLLAQGIKRVNSANNLAIPGIVSSFASGGAGGGGGASSSGPSGVMNAKSLPPTPQHSPSRKSSLVLAAPNTFEIVTQRLEDISADSTSLSLDEINAITQPILQLSKDDDIMTMAKNASKNLYNDLPGIERAGKINDLLSKLRLALDSETATHSSLTTKSPIADDGLPELSMSERNELIGRSEEKVQALSVIMLYLCTGLQHAQGVAFH